MYTYLKQICIGDYYWYIRINGKTSPESAANMRAVYPCSCWWQFTSAPCRKSNLHISSFPLYAACIRGVIPFFNRKGKKVLSLLIYLYPCLLTIPAIKLKHKIKWINKIIFIICIFILNSPLGSSINCWRKKMVLLPEVFYRLANRFREELLNFTWLVKWPGQGPKLKFIRAFISTTHT